MCLSSSLFAGFDVDDDESVIQFHWHQADDDNNDVVQLTAAAAADPSTVQSLFATSFNRDGVVAIGNYNNTTLFMLSLMTEESHLQSLHINLCRNWCLSLCLHKVHFVYYFINSRFSSLVFTHRNSTVHDILTVVLIL